MYSQGTTVYFFVYKDWDLQGFILFLQMTVPSEKKCPESLALEKNNLSDSGEGTIITDDEVRAVQPDSIHCRKTNY